MTGTLLAALSSEEVLLSSPLGIVTTNFVITRSTDARSQIILSLTRLTDIRTIKTSYPGLLVISIALFILAAAAMCSKDGNGTGVPMGLLGFGFSIAYLGTRKASIAFIAGSEVTETVSSSPRQATAFARVVESARLELPF